LYGGRVRLVPGNRGDSFRKLIVLIKGAVVHLRGCGRETKP
jgi:hypothetical protein